MKAAQIVKRYIATLEHFLEQGGYPIRVSKEEERLAVLIPALCVEDDLLQRDYTHDWDQELLIEFWKYKYMESKADANKLYNIIQEAHRKADS